MIRNLKLIRTCLLVLMFIANFYLFGIAQQLKEQKLRVLIVGFADRWVDYGSSGGTPRFRDFLAIRLGQQDVPDEFIKLRLLYWPQDKADPRQLAERSSREITFEALRELHCDESYSSLSRSGKVSLFDPELTPSRFVILRGAPKKRPPEDAILPCYEVHKVLKVLKEQSR